MEITKQQAVVTMIESAIEAYTNDDHVCAITLAGAAEEAMPRREETLFALLKFFGSIVFKSEKTAHDVLNFERNWLKHYSADEPILIELTQAFVMIRRAQSRYRAVYGAEAETPTMRTFFSGGK